MCHCATQDEVLMVRMHDDGRSQNVDLKPF